MKRILLLIGLVFLGFSGKSQIIKDLRNVELEDSDENVTVKKLYSDSESSTFLIRIRKSVKAHRHERHTEQVFVLAGRAEMQLNGKKTVVRKGDWIVIPKGAIHSVRVLSRRPLKVVSVQSPEFSGKDRVFTEE